MNTEALTAANRFSGVAEGYDRHRPDYPAELLAEIVAEPAPSAPRLALDVGAGTGIATRLIAANLAADRRVIGIEPNADMRAQAIHWFDRPWFYAEAGRVLAPGGALTILYNDRDLTGPGLLGEFETLMEREIPPSDRHYRQSDGAEDDQDRELEALDWTARVVRHRSRHAKVMRLAEFAGLMLSRSKLKPYAAKYGADEARHRLEALAAKHVDGAGRVAVGMTARVHIAIRK